MCCMIGPEATAPYFAGEASAPSAAKASDRERREQQAVAGSREGSPSCRAQGACQRAPDGCEIQGFASAA